LLIGGRVAALALPALILPPIATAIALPSVVGRPALVLPAILFFAALVHGLLLIDRFPRVNAQQAKRAPRIAPGALACSVLRKA